MDFDQVLAMTKGHIALGGGGLALFGSGCLFCWPENLSVRSDLYYLPSYFSDIINSYTCSCSYTTTLTYVRHFLRTLTYMRHFLGSED